MHKPDFASIRKTYSLGNLDEASSSTNAMEQFQRWMDEAMRSGIEEPTAFTLSTVDKGSQPSARVVLLKGVDTGFVFYTHYESRKGQALASQPLCSASFFWPELERQIRIEGRAERVGREQSEAYFHSRPWESQLSAFVSPQSRTVASRDELETLTQEARDRFAGQSIPLPENWGGYRIIPQWIEFWQGRPNRLHDRLVYVKQSDAWQRLRLAP